MKFPIPSLFASLVFITAGCAVPRVYSLSQHEVWTFQRGKAGELVQREVWTEEQRGGGNFFLSADTTSNLCVWHTNQTALGGGTYFRGNGLATEVSTNAGAIISAGGTAVGNAIATAVKR